MSTTFRSAQSIEACLKAVVNEPSIEDLTADSRLVSIPWRENISKPGKRLKIGWWFILGFYSPIEFYECQVDIKVVKADEPYMKL